MDTNNTDKRFDVITAKKDNLPVAGMIDRSYKDFSEIHPLQWFLWINIPLQKKREDGLSTTEEDSILDKIEENIEKEISSKTKIFFVGRITWNGSRELFYYLQDAEIANSKLDNLVKNPPYERGFQYEMNKDIEHTRVTEMFGW